MNIVLIFNIFLCVSIVIIIGSILLRLKKKFRLHRPILISVLLLLSSVLGRIAHRTVSTGIVFISRDSIGVARGVDAQIPYLPNHSIVYLTGDIYSAARLLVNLSILTIAVVCLATIVESTHMGIRHLRKKRRQQKAAA